MMAYLASLSRLEILNATLAILAALAAFASINLLRDISCHTDMLQTVILSRRGGANWRKSLLAGLRSIETMGFAWSLVTLAAGLAGQALGVLAGEWQNGVDTLMFGGVLAVLIANRRSMVFIGEYKHVASLAITMVCWVAFLARAH